MNHKHNALGYTILEMMIVVAVISVLIALASTSYATAQRRARDAKRKLDIRQVQQGLEQYFSQCGGAYPTPQSSFYGPITCNGNSIMPTIPADPRSTPYACPTVTNCTGTGYRICATLESETPNTYCLNNAQ